MFFSFICFLSSTHTRTRTHLYRGERWLETSNKPTQQPSSPLAKFVPNKLVSLSANRLHTRQWKTKNKAFRKVHCAFVRTNEHRKWLIVGLKVSILFKSFRIYFMKFLFESIFSFSFPFSVCVCVCINVSWSVSATLIRDRCFHNFCPKDELDRANGAFKFQQKPKGRRTAAYKQQCFKRQQPLLLLILFLCVQRAVRTVKHVVAIYKSICWCIFKLIVGRAQEKTFARTNSMQSWLNNK